MSRTSAPDIGVVIAPIDPSEFIYCKNCGHRGLRDSFPLSGPAEELSSVRTCALCNSIDLINMASMNACEKCEEREATEGRMCRVCDAEFHKTFLDMYGPGE